MSIRKSVVAIDSKLGIFIRAPVSERSRIVQADVKAPFPNTIFPPRSIRRRGLTRLSMFASDGAIRVGESGKARCYQRLLPCAIIFAYFYELIAHARLFDLLDEFHELSNAQFDLRAILAAVPYDWMAHLNHVTQT